jgi:hypothetical protein
MWRDDDRATESLMSRITSRAARMTKGRGFGRLCMWRDNERATESLMSSDYFVGGENDERARHREFSVWHHAERDCASSFATRAFASAR